MTHIISFSCADCHKTYATQVKYRRHRREVHGDMSEQKPAVKTSFLLERTLNKEHPCLDCDRVRGAIKEK